MKFIVHIFCLFPFLTAYSLHAEERAETLTVVELFTSQGCNACPPADNILKELAQDESLLALSYAVDYWDYLGWKDTFSDPENTKRQKKYNKSLGKNRVYTPQMIIQGQKDAVGSHASDIQEKILWAKNLAPEGPWLDFRAMGHMLSLSIGADKLRTEKTVPSTATVWMVCYDREKSIHIKGGELKGRVKSYHNIVRALRRMGSWMGQEIKLTLEKRDLYEEDCSSYAVILQQDETGPILAAARLENAP